MKMTSRNLSSDCASDAKLALVATIEAPYPANEEFVGGIVPAAVKDNVSWNLLNNLCACGLLRQIEMSKEPVYIKRLDLRRRYEDRTRFDATIVAGAMSKT